MTFMEQGLLVRHSQLNYDTFELEFIAPSICSECQPGQFVHIRPGIDYDPLLRRPLSLYDLDKNSGSITLLYKVVGRGTSQLTRIRPKEYVDVMGPLGKGFSLPGKHKNIVLVAGGIGIAPLVYLARVLKEKNYNVRVLHGVENCRQLLVTKKLAEIGVECLAASNDGSAGFRGLVTDLLSENINPEEIDYLYTCGPEAMMSAVAAFARKHGIPGELSLEEYMACGVGACLGCARKLKAEDEQYVKICKDGPVFPIDEVEF